MKSAWRLPPRRRPKAGGYRRDPGRRLAATPGRRPSWQLPPGRRPEAHRGHDHAGPARRHPDRHWPPQPDRRRRLGAPAPQEPLGPDQPEARRYRRAAPGRRLRALGPRVPAELDLGRPDHLHRRAARHPDRRRHLHLEPPRLHLEPPRPLGPDQPQARRRQRAAPGRRLGPLGPRVPAELDLGGPDHLHRRAGRHPDSRPATSPGPGPAAPAAAAGLAAPPSAAPSDPVAAGA